MNKNSIAISIIAASTVLIIYLINLTTIQWPAEQAKNNYWEQEAKYAPENSSLICPPAQSGDSIDPNSCKRVDHYRYDRDYQIRDQKAQVSMRNAAWVGLLFGLIGMVLIWETLKATQQATTIAREVGEKQIRGYGSVRNGRFVMFNNILGVWFSVKNFGNSPIENISITLTVMVTDSLQHPKNEFWFSNFVLLTMETFEIGPLETGEILETARLEFGSYTNLGPHNEGFTAANTQRWHIIGELTEQDVFGKTHKHSFKATPILEENVLVGADDIHTLTGKFKVEKTSSRTTEA